MTARSPKRIALLAATVAVFPLVAGCSALGGGDGPADTGYVARDAESLYAAAKDRLDRGDVLIAAALFDEVERQHPYSPWARRAQLMSAFSYYVAEDYNKSIESAQRFLQIHPGNKDAPYAYYLIALSYYEQINDVDRDQAVTLQALTALQDVQRRFPNSEYASDARVKIDLVEQRRRDLHVTGVEPRLGRRVERFRVARDVAGLRGVLLADPQCGAAGQQRQGGRGGGDKGDPHGRACGHAPPYSQHLGERQVK